MDPHHLTIFFYNYKTRKHYAESSLSSSSSDSMPTQECRCFHYFTPLFTVISSVQGGPGPQLQVLLFEVILDGA